MGKQIYKFMDVPHLFIAAAVVLWASGAFCGGIVADHTCTALNRIPDRWIESAKQLTLHYAHTSHGSQIISGIENLESIYPVYSVAVRANPGPAGLPPVEDPPALRIYDQGTHWRASLQIDPFPAPGVPPGITEGRVARAIRDAWRALRGQG